MPLCADGSANHAGCGKVACQNSLSRKVWPAITFYMCCITESHLQIAWLCMECKSAGCNLHGWEWLTRHQSTEDQGCISGFLINFLFHKTKSQDGFKYDVGWYSGIWRPLGCTFMDLNLLLEMKEDSGFQFMETLKHSYGGEILNEGSGLWPANWEMLLNNLNGT